MANFLLNILAAEKKVYRGMCSSMIFPATDGQYGVLAHHQNTIMAAVPGELTVCDEHGEKFVFVVSTGLVKIEENEVLVLVETAERPEEIDRLRAERAAIEAKEALLLKKSLQDRRSAEMKLARAISRMRAKSSINNR